MNSFDNGGPLDQLFTKAKEFAGRDPETRRRLTVDFVMERLELSGPKEKVTRFVVERLYDRLIPAAPQVPRPGDCPHCGLNDGHHYVGCKALETR